MVGVHNPLRPVVPVRQPRGGSVPRTGSEGRISHVKRDFGLNRTRYTGIDGARTWCGHGVFNHNLVKIATLLDSTG